MADSPAPWTVSIGRWHLLAAVAAVLLFLGLGGYLWLDAHDAHIRGEQQTAAAVRQNQPLLDANARLQKSVEDLQAGQKKLDEKLAGDRAASDARFDKASSSLVAMAAMMASVTGSKTPGQVVQPGADPAHPRGGVFLDPGQVAANHQYEKACEDCKLERDRLREKVAEDQGALAKAGAIHANDLAVHANDQQTIQQLNQDLKRGFRYRLEACATDVALGGASAAAGAMAQAPAPGQPRQYKKAIAAGGVLGLFKCIVARH